jgi:hypothetical protein
MVKYYCKDNNFEKMKLTALVILLSFSLKISGQQITQPTNHYRSGDVLKKKKSQVFLTCGSSFFRLPIELLIVVYINSNGYYQ